MNIKQIITASLLCVTLSSCNSFFDKDNTPPPSPLVSFKPEAHPHLVWDTKPGIGIGKDYIKLLPAVAEQSIFTADIKGNVTATDKSSGKKRWATQVPFTITSGPTVGDHIVVVAGRDGKITALNQVDGNIIWGASTSTEVLAAPAIQNGIVLIKTIDGQLSAFASSDGHLLWSYQHPEPNLILRGSSTPQIINDKAIIGFANGELVALNQHNGNLLWQQVIAIPEGAFAIQRMVDIDANPFAFGNRIYAATYQGRISALNAASGETIWSHDISSYTGITADNEQIYITDARSHLWAFDSKEGYVNWQQNDLEARNITAPVLMNNYIVVGDSEGYLHWINKKDGHFVARLRVNSSGMIASPVSDNGVLYVLTKDGHLAAYSLS